MDRLLDMVTVCTLVITAAGLGYLLCVMATIVDTATGRRWGLLTLSVLFAAIAVLLARVGCAW